MPRIACLLVPHLPLAAPCRAAPDLPRRPVAPPAGTGTHATEVVPAGTELGFLAPLPLACLAPPPAIAATLERWGIRRLGDLARLPVAEVATRLGPAGAALVRTARGEDERPLAPQALGGPVEEAIDLEYALDALEPLLFVLRGLVERAVGRGRRGAVDARRHARAAVRQRLPARRACAPAAASRRGVRGPRPPRLRPRRGPGRARGRRGGTVAGGGRVVERRRLRARLLRHRTLRRRPLPLLPGGRAVVRRWRVRLTALSGGRRSQSPGTANSHPRRRYRE